MIRIGRHIVIDEVELKEEFVRAPGPGGQNVNKVSTAVQLRFDAAANSTISADVRARLATLAGQRMTKDGVILISASRFRSQERNRADARARLTELIRQAAQPPKKRRPTRPTLASKHRRIEGKKHRGAIKSGRGRAGFDD